MIHRTVIVLVLSVLLVPGVAKTQNTAPDSVSYTGSLSAGLGVIVVTQKDIAAYINSGFTPVQSISEMTSAAEFYGAAEFGVTPSWIARLDYGYLLKTIEIPSPFGPNFQFTYTVHMPTLLADYRIIGRGYYIKFGGGLGYHFIQFKEDLAGQGNTWHGAGPAVKLELNGNVQLDTHLYVDLGGELRFDFLGDLKDDSGNTLNAAGNNVSATFAGAGVRLGLLYTF